MARLLDEDDGSILVRTEFSDDEAWRNLVIEATRPYEPDGYMAYFVPVEDRTFEGLGPAELAALEGNASVVYAADSLSMNRTEPTLLVVDRLHDRGRFFRVILEEAWAVENNLSLANMDFFEFADAAQDDGVFRGF